MWELCDFCKQIKQVVGSNHKCPELAKIKREIEIENTVQETMTVFEISQLEFWNDPDVKFYEYLADRKKI